MPAGDNGAECRAPRFDGLRSAAIDRGAAGGAAAPYVLEAAVVERREKRIAPGVDVFLVKAAAHDCTAGHAAGVYFLVAIEADESATGDAVCEHVLNAAGGERRLDGFADNLFNT